MECLQTALYFGADAVYLAGKSYGLRAFADNFTMEELAEAVGLAHGLGRRVYVTANAISRNDELEGLASYFAQLKKIKADAVIVSDPGVLLLAREAGLEVHLSTQASTSNTKSACFWHAQGVKRIVMAREISLAEIREIREQTPGTLEIEAFIHGAMCVAYSGRCLLSSVLTGRSGNKGACAQPCRWEYAISEAGYPGQYFPILEDEKGTYILNSKDLMMIEHIPEMVQAGIDSFKIEGRMKSAYYVGCVVNAYRRAIDAYLAAPEGYMVDPALVEELRESATRQFTTGFFFGNPHEEGQDIQKSLMDRQTVFCAKVLEGRDARGYIRVEQRNKFSLGERLSVLSPHMPFCDFAVEEIRSEEGEAQEAAPHPQQVLWIPCPYDLHPGDMLRRRG